MKESKSKWIVFLLIISNFFSFEFGVDDVKGALKTFQKIIEEFFNKPTNSTPIDSTPSDAVKYNGHSYKLIDMGLTWYDAKAYCESLGGHLVTITSGGEQAFIENLLKVEGYKNCYWIGCKLNSSNQMTWITNEYMTYSNWLDGEPDNYQGKQGYGLIEGKKTRYRNFVGKWGDIHYSGNSWDGDKYPFWGTENFGFICEWEN